MPTIVPCGTRYWVGIEPRLGVLIRVLWGLGFIFLGGLKVDEGSLGFRLTSGFGGWMWGLGFRVEALGFRFWGLRIRVW